VQMILIIFSWAKAGIRCGFKKKIFDMDSLNLVDQSSS
jgi:hypothetical protein